MAEEKILDALEDEKQVSLVSKKKFSFEGFFKDKRNIFALVAVVLGILAIVLYLVLPAVFIDLTDEGKDIANKNASTIPEMANYHQSISGINVLFGIGTYDVWKNVETSAVLETQKLVFNVPLLVGLILILAGVIMIVVMTLSNKSNVLNKVILGLMIVGSIILLLTAIWFYAVNPITASTRYDTTNTIYPYGSINGHAAFGAIISALLGIAASVFSGLLIIPPVETR